MTGVKRRSLRVGATYGLCKLFQEDTERNRESSCSEHLRSPLENRQNARKSHRKCPGRRYYSHLSRVSQTKHLPEPREQRQTFIAFARRERSEIHSLSLFNEDELQCTKNPSFSLEGNEILAGAPLSSPHRCSTLYSAVSVEIRD